MKMFHKQTKQIELKIEHSHIDSLIQQHIHTANTHWHILLCNKHEIKWKEKPTKKWTKNYIRNLYLSATKNIWREKNTRTQTQRHDKNNNTLILTIRVSVGHTKTHTKEKWNRSWLEMKKKNPLNWVKEG